MEDNLKLNENVDERALSFFWFEYMYEVGISNCCVYETGILNTRTTKRVQPKQNSKSDFIHNRHIGISHCYIICITQSIGLEVIFRGKFTVTADESQGKKILLLTYSYMAKYRMLPVTNQTASGKNNSNE